jgi:hypothetical protein
MFEHLEVTCEELRPEHRMSPDCAVAVLDELVIEYEKQPHQSEIKSPSLSAAHRAGR